MNKFRNIFTRFSQFSNLLLLSIVVLGFVLRFYNFPIRISVDRDASLDALVARGGSQELQLPLVGPFSSAAPITTGPWYYYQMILANLIVPSVYAPWISFALSSLILILVMYRVGTLLLNKRLGLVLAFIAAVSPVQVSLSTGLGNASLLGQFTGIIIWLFLEIVINRKSYWWQFFLGFMLGLSVNYHFQSILLFPFFLFLLWKKKTFIKSLLSALTGLLISFLPLLFFDLNNHWYNTRHIFTFIILRQNAAIEIRRWLTYLFSFWPNLFSSIIGVPKILSLLILFLGICSFLFYVVKEKQKAPKFYLALVFFFQFLFLRYYSGPLRDNYVQFVHPFLFIFTGAFIIVLTDLMIWILKLINIKNNYLLPLFQIITIAIFTLLILPQLQNQTKPNSATLGLRQEASALEKNLTNQSIAVYRCHNSNMTKPWSIALMLDMDQKLWTPRNKNLPGEKIGFFDNSSCEKKYQNSTEIINLTGLNEEEIAKNNWELVTPHTVYDSMVKWWYEEKP